MKPSEALRALWSKEERANELGLVVHGAGRSLVLQGVGLGLGYLVHVLFARWLGAAEYGVYTYALAWVALLSVPAGLGISTLVVRFVPEYQVGGAWSSLRGLVQWGGTRVLAAGVGLAVCASGVIWLMDPDTSGAYTQPLFVGLWIVPLQALLGVVSGVFRGRHRLGSAYLSPALRHGLSLVIVLLLVESGRVLTSLDALWATFAAAAVVLGVQGSILWAGLPTPVRRARSRYDAPAWRRIAFPLLLAGAFTLLLSQADVIMVGTMMGPREAGLYKAASKTASLVSLALLAVGAAAAPMVATLHAQGAKHRLQRLVSAAAHWVFWPSLGLTMVFVAAAQPVLGLFGAEFAEASWVLIALAVGQLVNAGTGIAGVSLSMTGYQNEVAWVIGGSAVLNVALNAVGIVFLGLTGAALATSATLMLSNLGLCRIMTTKMNVNPSILFGLSARGASR